MNKETEQLKRKYYENFSKEGWEDKKGRYSYPYFDGTALKKDIWQFIEEALANQTTTLKKKVEEMKKKEDHTLMRVHNNALDRVLNQLNI